MQSHASSRVNLEPLPAGHRLPLGWRATGRAVGADRVVEVTVCLKQAGFEQLESVLREVSWPAPERICV